MPECGSTCATDQPPIAWRRSAGRRPAGRSVRPPSAARLRAPHRRAAAGAACRRSVRRWPRKPAGAAGADLDDGDLFDGPTPAEAWQGPSQADNVDAPLHAFAAPKPIAAPTSTMSISTRCLATRRPASRRHALPPPPTRQPVAAPATVAHRRGDAGGPTGRRHTPAPADAARCWQPFWKAPGSPDWRSAPTRMRRCAPPAPCSAKWWMACARS